MKDQSQAERIAVLEAGLSTAQLALDGLARRIAALEATSEPSVSAVPAANGPSVIPSRPNGKYAVLTDWLQAQTARRAINATFEDVEKILGFSLPESAYNYQPYWQGLPNPLARAVLAAGWKVTSLSLTGQTLVFRRASI